MNRNEYLKHLDRAFTQAPPELATSVEEAFRRGEEAMKQRHKIMTAVSIAAILAVLCAAIALAAGAMLRPRVDNVVAAPRGGEGEYGSETASPGESTTAGRTTPTPVPEAANTEIMDATDVTVNLAPVAEEHTAVDDATAVYYATPQGKYYHEDAQCSGMKGALPWSAEALWFEGKQACPVCVETFNTPMLFFYATKGGQYFHLDPHCSGMMNATQCSEEAAKAAGKTRCPVCLPEDYALCWATPEGQYYHYEQDCMAMKNAIIFTELFCKVNGKQACPVCWDVYDVTSFEGLVDAPETAETDSGEATTVSRGPMSAEAVKALVQSLDEKALKAKEFWIYPSSEANGAWVFYATGWDSNMMTFKGGAWYVGDSCVCLGHSDGVLNFDFFTPGSTDEPDAPEDEVWYRGGSHIPYGPELFTSSIRKGEETRVHVWKLGEDGVPMELDTGKLYNLYTEFGMLCGETDAKHTDCCFLREHDGRLCQVCGQPEEISVVEKLPGCAALLDEIRADYTVTDCLYRSMGTDTEAEVVTVNLLNEDGKPYHTYLFRDSQAEPFQTSVTWGDGVDVYSGIGSIRIDAGLPTVTSGGIEATYKGRENRG